jgi:precorrin-4 methylase
VITGTLQTIAAEVRRANVQPPATLVVGEVVRLREKLNQLIASSYVKCENKNSENKNKEEVPV